MAFLSALPIQEMKNLFNLNAFIETGSGQGNGINDAVKAGYELILSCDAVQDYFDHCKNRFKSTNHIKLFKGVSVDMLPIMLDLCVDKRILFWLDSHLFGYYSGSTSKCEYDLPVWSELNIILSHKHNFSSDIICVDDTNLFLSKYKKVFDLSKWSNFESFIDVDWIKSSFSTHLFGLYGEMMIGVPKDLGKDFLLKCGYNIL